MVMTYVWDAPLLLHAQSAQRGDVLGDLLPRGRHITTDVVFSEIAAGVPDWIDVVQAPSDPEYLAALQVWRLRCAAGRGRHEGEASALAPVENARDDDIAVVDDGDARAVGRRHLGEGRVHGSLWLLCRGIDEEPARRTSVSRFCDAVLADGIRWPFGVGGFDAWAVAQRLLT